MSNPCLHFHKAPCSVHPCGGASLRTLAMTDSGPSTTLSPEVTLVPIPNRTSTGVTLHHLSEPQIQLIKQESHHFGLIPKPMVLTTSQRKRKCGLESAQRKIENSKTGSELCGTLKTTDVGANGRVEGHSCPGTRQPKSQFSSILT